MRENRAFLLTSACRLEWMDTPTQRLYQDQPWDTLMRALEFIENARKNGG